jgi:hypothetical protein
LESPAGSLCIFNCSPGYGALGHTTPGTLSGSAPLGRYSGMAITVTVIDETSPGRETARFALELLEDRLTVRELIRGRIRQAVAKHNLGLGSTVHRPVQPTQTEAILNGPKAAVATRRADWEAQCERAFAAFRSGSLIVLVDDRQLENLDDTVFLGPKSEVTFFKIVPLVGG